MSAANDGAGVDSKMAAIAKSLIFISVLAVLPITVISFSVSVMNSTPPVEGINRQSHATPDSLLFAG
jgi:hypothetical protein